MWALNTFINPNDLNKGDNTFVMYFYNEYTATRDSELLIQQVHVNLFRISSIDAFEGSSFTDARKIATISATFLFDDRSAGKPSAAALAQSWIILLPQSR